MPAIISNEFSSAGKESDKYKNDRNEMPNQEKKTFGQLQGLLIQRDLLTLQAMKEDQMRGC